MFTGSGLLAQIDHLIMRRVLRAQEWGLGDRRHLDFGKRLSHYPSTQGNAVGHLAVLFRFQSATMISVLRGERRASDPQDVFVGDMGIDHRGLPVPVAQKFLD